MFTTGSPYTNTIVITAEIESGFVDKDDLVPFRCTVQFPRARHHSKWRRRWVGVKGSTRNGRRDPKCSSARRFRMIRENTRAPSEGGNCAWMAADEAVGCTRAFFTMWQSSRRLVCRGRPEPGLRVNDISRIYWSQHLLTTQSEWPNSRAIRIADHPAIIMPMSLPLSNSDSCSYYLRKRCNGMSTSALPFVNVSTHSNKLWLPVLYSSENNLKRPLPAIREVVLLPQIPMILSLTNPFKCLQFPIRSAFAMTINKSQGQTMTICGLDLENPCFLHGQLHVVCPSDEVHFWLNGYVNKQNCRIWSEANPRVYVETPLHPEKLTVWCALWAGGILLQKR
ncbi:uncharacterized protein TNCV_4665911 [Trichonephila clavipes]|nr:uncharacterized protein TNCV_4665911 [Trichonephila clavipes]